MRQLPPPPKFRLVRRWGPFSLGRKLPVVTTTQPDAADHAKRYEGYREFLRNGLVVWQYMVEGALNGRSHFSGPETCGARDGEKTRVQRDGGFDFCSEC